MNVIGKGPLAWANRRADLCVLGDNDKNGSAEVDSLTRRLDAFMDSLAERVGAQTLSLISAGGQAQNPPGVGDIAPEFELPDQQGRMVSLSGLRAKGPVVLTFFRGNWCPFCSLTLRALDEVRSELTTLGASLVAISPQTAELAAATSTCNGLRFPILTDAGNAVARRWGLAWELCPEQKKVFGKLGHPLPRYNGGDDWTLPIPAGFVVGRDGRVGYVHVDSRVNRRLEPQVAVDAVRRMAEPAVSSDAAGRPTDPAA